MKIFQDIKKYFGYLIYATRSQLKSEVANSYLNWLWWLLEPLMDVVLYTVIFGLFFNSQVEHFPVFVFIGITIWGFFCKSLNQSVQLIKNNAAIVSKVYIPKQILLIKVLLVNGFKMLVAFGVTVLMFCIFRIPVNLCLLYMIPILIELFLLTYGLACFLMHFGVYVNDLAYIVSILLNMLMFGSGVFYSIPDKAQNLLGSVMLYGNPIAFIMYSTRQVTMYRTEPDNPAFIVWFAVSFVLACFGTMLVYKNENSYVKAI